MVELNNQVIENLIEKNDTESTTAYSAFLYWALMLPNQRKYEISAPILAERFGLSESTLKNIRSQNKWEERVNQLDAYLFKVSIQQRAEMFEENNKQLATDMRDIQRAGIECSRLALNTVKMLLETVPMANKVLETDWVRAVQPDGTTKKLPRTTEFKMDFSLRDASNLLREGLNAPIKAMGLPTEVVRYSVLHQDTKPIETKPDDELNREIAQLKRDLESTIQEIPNQ